MSRNSKRARTCLAKYGFEHPMQNPEIRRRSQRRYSYYGIKFDSSYELALYIWLQDASVDFEYQPDVSFEYFDGKGKRRFCHPDFRIEGFLYEVKGLQFVAKDGRWINPYDRKEDHVYEAKRRCCLSHGVKIVTDCDEFLDYVRDRYGSDFADRYRNSPEKKGPSKAELNPYFRNRKLDLPDTESNVYRKRCPEMFEQLWSLVEAYPKSYARKLDAKGRKREIDAGTMRKPEFHELKRWIESQLPEALYSSKYKTTTKVAWILLGLTDFPECSGCGKRDGYVGKNICVAKPYGPYCCLDCAYRSKSRSDHVGDTKERRYGSRTYVNSEKARKTRASRVNKSVFRKEN